MRALKFLIAFLFVGMFIDADAARRLPRPQIGPTAFQAVDDGYAVDIKDCTFTNPYATASDTESSSGTVVSKPVGTRYDKGQIACQINATPGSYKLWLTAKSNDVTPVQRVGWANNEPFKSGFQNERGFAVTVGPSFVTFPVGDGLEFSDMSMANAQTSLTLGSGSVIYLMADAAIVPDWMFVSTNASATPIPPSGLAVGTGVAHQGSSVGAAGEDVSQLQFSLVVGAGADRVANVGVCHRTGTNTITSVVSDIDGAFTLRHWSQINNNVGNGTFHLIAPSVATHTITVTMASAQNVAASGSVYTGAHQTTPFTGTTATTGSGNVSTQIASSSDHLAVDHLCAAVTNTEVLTVGANQTQHWQKEVDITGTGNRISASSTEQPSTVAVMEWALGGTNAWVHHVAALRPVDAVAPDPPVVGAPSVSFTGATSATVKASVDQTAQCTVEYDIDSGAPYANSDGPFGSSGGFCGDRTLTGLAQTTQHFFRICADNGTNTVCSSENDFTTTASGATIYSLMDAETGDMSQWGRAVASGGNTTAPIAVQAPAPIKSGSWSYKYEMAVGGPGAKKSMTESYLPNLLSMGSPNGRYLSGFYSFWIYLAEGYTGNDWRMLIGWMTGVSGAPDPIGHVELRRWPISPLGPLQLGYHLKNALTGQCYTAPQIAGYEETNAYYFQTANSPNGITTFPEDQWVHVEVYYKMAATNGQVIIWQDGVEVMNLSHPAVNTFHGWFVDPCKNSAGDILVQFGIYEGNHPAGDIMYMDDLKVSDVRLGPN